MYKYLCVMSSRVAHSAVHILVSFVDTRLLVVSDALTDEAVPPVAVTLDVASAAAQQAHTLLLQTSTKQQNDINSCKTAPSHSQLNPATTERSEC